MTIFGIWGKPNIEKLRRSGNLKGLNKAMHYKKDFYIRIAAIEALSQITFHQKRFSHIPLKQKHVNDMCLKLVECLKDDNQQVREAAFNAIAVCDKRYFVKINIYGATKITKMEEILWSFFQEESDFETRKLLAKSMEDRVLNDDPENYHSVNCNEIRKLAKNELKRRNLKIKS